MSEILTAIKEVAACFPYKIAVSDDKQTLTYRELFSQIRSAAGHLSAYRGQVVALLADNSPAWLFIDLAAQQAGVILLPLPIYFTTSQIQHALQSAAAQALIYSPDNLSGEFLRNRTREPQAFGNYSLQLIKGPFGSAINLPDGTNKITFTSGSTGTPKGVCLSNCQQLKVAKSLLTATELQSPRHLAVLPLSTLLENIAGVYAPLLAGGEVMLMPLTKKGYLAGHQQFLQSLIDSQPETMILVPELLTGLVNAVLSGWQPPSSLKFIAVGGSRVAADLIHKSRQLGLPVFEGYGLSEAGSVVSLNTKKADKPGSAGKVLPHLTVSIENGEVVIENSDFLGYIGDQQTSAKKWFTGDMGELNADGFLTINGRKKQLIISSYGRNINPEWIESEVLANSAISQCVVVGDGQPFCSALIYSTLNNTQLQQHIDQINQSLPSYARILRWHRLAHPITTKHGLLTGNGRPQRAAINLFYQDVINHFYQGETDGLLYHTTG